MQIGNWGNRIKMIITKTCQDRLEAKFRRKEIAMNCCQQKPGPYKHCNLFWINWKPISNFSVLTGNWIWHLKDQWPWKWSFLSWNIWKDTGDITFGIFDIKLQNLRICIVYNIHLCSVCQQSLQQSTFSSWYLSFVSTRIWKCLKY